MIKHALCYRSEPSEFDDKIPYDVEILVEDEKNLQEMIEIMEDYLLRCGYVFPENTELALVPKT